MCLISQHFLKCFNTIQLKKSSYKIRNLNYFISQQGIFMHVTNELEFGRTLYNDEVPINQDVRHPDMWQIDKNHVVCC